ncbi:MAG: hypothetical protein ACXWX1_12615, partial [Aeromicrobium sp.]
RPTRTLAPASSIFTPIEVTVPEGWHNLQGWIVNWTRSGFSLVPRPPWSRIIAGRSRAARSRDGIR